VPRRRPYGRSLWNQIKGGPSARTSLQSSDPMLGVTGSGIEDILNGLAALMWPVVVITAIIIFTPEIRGFLRRIRMAKMFGGRVVFDKDLDKLQSGATAFEATPIPTVIPVEPEPVVVAAEASIVAGFTATAVGTAYSPTVTVSGDQLESEIEVVLGVAAMSPKAGLIQLSSDLERTTRRIIAITGHIGEMRSGASLRELAEILERVTTLPRGSLDVFGTLAQVRNEIVHGSTAVTDDEIMRAIDSGIVLLRSLKAVPLEINVVEHPGVAIYADSSGNDELPGKGVILITTSPGGAVTSRRIFPTLRGHFVAGMQVAWEWDSTNVWGEAWYLDPDTHEFSVAWTSSMKFVGRDLADV
jgi:hypothetical protein